MSLDRWPTDREISLRTLWAAGKSASQIAAELGSLTRNAVVGKLHRLGLKRNDRPRPPPRPRSSPPMRSTPFRAPKPPADTDSPRPIPAAPNGQPVDLLGLTNATCRWPIGDEVPQMFCGALEADNPDQPYCPFHTAAAHGYRLPLAEPSRSA